MTDPDSSSDGVYPLPDSESSDSRESFRHVKPLPNTPIYPSVNNNIPSFIKFKFVVKREQDEENHLDRVPDEILLLILDRLRQRDLARLAQTCRRLRKLSYSKRYWRRVNLCCRVHVDTDVVGHILTRRAKCLNMQVSKVVSPVFSTPMYRYLSNHSFDLTLLDISYAMISTCDINAVLSLLTNLEVLLMEEACIDDRTCVYIGRNSKLSTLGMAMVSGLTSEGIKDILIPCQSLQYLNLSWASKSEIRMFDCVVNNVNCNLLEIALAGVGLLSQQLKRLLLRCTSLRKLDVSDNSSLEPLSDDMFFSLQNLPLVGLYAARTPLLNNFERNWIDKLVNLEELDIITFLRVFKVQPSVRCVKKLDSGIARPLHDQNTSTHTDCRSNF